MEIECTICSRFLKTSRILSEGFSEVCRRLWGEIRRYLPTTFKLSRPPSPLPPPKKNVKKEVIWFRWGFLKEFWFVFICFATVSSTVQQHCLDAVVFPFSWTWGSNSVSLTLEEEKSATLTYVHNAFFWGRLIYFEGFLICSFLWSSL